MDISIVFYLPLSPSYSFYLLSKLSLRNLSYHNYHNFFFRVSLTTTNYTDYTNFLLISFFISVYGDVGVLARDAAKRQ